MLVWLRPHVAAGAAALVVLAAPLAAQQHITTPKEQFGFDIGDDYQLANYTQLTEYWKKIDAESDRVRVRSIGKTAEGRDQLMAIVTSPANFAKLDHYKDIAERLARAEGLTDDEARALAREGKAVIWIDGGLHATEVLGAHQLMEHLYEMASKNDPETLRILDDVIQVLVHANPDGMELVSNWYMRRSDPTQRSTDDLPRLYQKYVGHDNNRDFYMNAMPETQNMSRILFRQWYPEIVYNHHQTGPAGAVMFSPPFRDPQNYFLGPILMSTLSMVGEAMHTRFAAEGKPGVVTRNASNYQTWWNGGLRTAPYFHNMVGLLTETIGNPTPITIPLVPDMLVANGSDPFPVLPREWHFKQSIEYSMTANRAVLDYASRYREQLLYNIYLMGRNQIRRGNEDSWTITPSMVAKLEAAAAKDSNGTVASFRGTKLLNPTLVSLLRRPEDRDPRGYVLPSDQSDFLTATAFVDALIRSGIAVQYATRPFTVSGRQYPAGSYVIKTAQAFGAHVMDMMEPQDYPNDLAYPGGPPKPPYDNTGYTLAMQMGVKYDRILDGFDCPCTRIDDVLAKPPVAASLPKARTYALSRRVNDSYLAVNRLLTAGQRVEAVPGSDEIRVPATGQSTKILQALVSERGLPVAAATGRAAGAAPFKPVRVGLWDQYGGSSPSGWVRWILEQFEFPFQLVYAPRLDQGNLAQQFDVLIFVGGSIPARAAGNAVSRRQNAAREAPSDLPAQYQNEIGRVTVEETVPQLKAFLEAGGRIVTIGSATALARHLGLPMESQLVERSPDGAVKPLPQEKYYLPGSLLEVAVDSTAQSALGMNGRAIVFFDEDPVFRLDPDARAKGVRPVAWFDTASPLRSGWAWGQTFLDQGVVAAEAKVGRGTLYLFTPEITFRSQPHGTYRFLFNGILGR